MGRGYEGDSGEMRSGETAVYMLFILVVEGRKWDEFDIAKEIIRGHK